VLVTISEPGERSLRFLPRQLAELVLAIETGVALEQVANPDALWGRDLPVVSGLTSWFASAPVLAQEES
jgi:hypothetical protein